MWLNPQIERAETQVAQDLALSPLVGLNSSPTSSVTVLVQKGCEVFPHSARNFEPQVLYGK